MHRQAGILLTLLQTHLIHALPRPQDAPSSAFNLFNTSFVAPIATSTPEPFTPETMTSISAPTTEVLSVAPSSAVVSTSTFEAPYTSVYVPQGSNFAVIYTPTTSSIFQTTTATIEAPNSTPTPAESTTSVVTSTSADLLTSTPSSLPYSIVPVVALSSTSELVQPTPEAPTSAFVLSLTSTTSSFESSSELAPLATTSALIITSSTLILPTEDLTSATPTSTSSSIILPALVTLEPATPTTSSEFELPTPADVSFTPSSSNFVVLSSSSSPSTSTAEPAPTSTMVSTSSSIASQKEGTVSALSISQSSRASEVLLSTAVLSSSASQIFETATTSTSIESLAPLATSSASILSPTMSSSETLKTKTTSRVSTAHVSSSTSSTTELPAFISTQKPLAVGYTWTTETLTTTLVVDITKTITSYWTSTYATPMATQTPTSVDPPSTASPDPVPTQTSIASVSIESRISTSSAPSSTLTPKQSSSIVSVFPAPNAVSNSISTTTTTTTTTQPGVTITSLPPVTTRTSATIVVSQSESTTTVVVSLQTTLTTSETQTITVHVPPPTSGSIYTSLLTNGNSSPLPFNATVIPTPSSSIIPLTSGSGVISSTSTFAPTSMASKNIFAAVASGAPPPQITTQLNHPVPRQGIDQSDPIETNKFYANFFLGTRSAPAFTFPYSVSWAAGGGATGSWGVAVQQVSRSETKFGPGNPPSYYINPLGFQTIVLTAVQLQGTTSMTMSNLTGFSANVNLAPTSGAVPILTFPLVQGMAFLTGIYTGATPVIESAAAFLSLVYGGVVAGGSGTVRYIVTLNDQTTWFIYMTPATGGSVPTLTLATPQQILAQQSFTGTIQVAKSPNTQTVAACQALYDAAAGVYPTTANITGAVNGTAGSYTLSWTKGGLASRKLLMFALPHHVSSMSAATKASLKISFLLQTTTKGLATAVVADSWTMEETLPTSLGFAPWNSSSGPQTKLPASAIQLINSVAALELNENMTAQCDLNSMYYAGKALAKFASIVYATNNLGHAVGTASAGLANLKVQFARFVNNQQIFPLVYDSSWGGVVSSASYATGDSGVDFGNSYYNDHHFHYGYFVYAASVIAYLDPSWLKQGTNKAWVNSLVRDYANPVSDDGYFPFSRMFDWFHGHSWAAGLFESFDGKNQESSSEDTFASYALKLWGRTIGDANMEARGNLMLSVQARALNDYYLMQSTNSIQPPSYLPNKVGGILFENKMDHTTYFGTNIEYIEGIHMLPINPSSVLTRNKTFVSQEWDTYFSNGRVDTIAGGWRGILYANLALIDPVSSYNFFAQAGFDNSWLDGGASRTWNLALAAGLGGAS